jgi:hypothetical protein
VPTVRCTLRIGNFNGMDALLEALRHCAISSLSSASSRP